MKVLAHNLGSTPIDWEHQKNTTKMLKNLNFVEYETAAELFLRVS